MSRVEEAKRAIEEYKRLEAERSKLFDPDAAISDGNEIKSVEDEVLGVVKYGLLTMDEYAELQRKITDDYERAMTIASRMLAKAYPGFTYEKLKKLPIDVGIRLLNLLVRVGGFQAS